MPCGFDIKRSKEEILKANIDYSSNLKDKKTYVVDGNKYFNRPGPDLLESTRILAEIIHPDHSVPAIKIKILKDGFPYN